MKTRISLSFVVVMGAFLLSCASAPPKELVDARSAYQRARHGDAAQLSPADLHKAQVALERAERAFADSPRDQRTRDLAYIAERRAQLAEANAMQARDNLARAQAEQDFAKGQGMALNQAREQLNKSAEQLEKERIARLSAEGKTADAQRAARDLEESLARVAAVKEEERGLVISLSGSVLFESNKSTLLPSAQSRLSQVAEALAKNNRPIVVEGYTDSRGSDAYNRELSLKRAEAVRSFLVSRGVDPQLAKAEGRGKDNPIADNSSPEGRANNRRVEIVVAPKMEGDDLQGP